MHDLSLGEAARALGVSVDTLRRWDRSGRLRTVRDDANRRRVPAAELERLAPRPAADSPAPNRFVGVVRSIEPAGPLALVEIDAGAQRVQALVSRDDLQRLALVPGAGVTASVAPASVLLEPLSAAPDGRGP